MLFHEKLDFLMNITKTSNRVLAKKVTLDASYISRLRSGQRQPAKQENYLKPMAQYFALACKDELQRIALGDALKMGKALPTNPQTVASLIFQFLNEEQECYDKSLRSFLHSIGNFEFSTAPDLPESLVSEPVFIPYEKAGLYYGVEGKRRSILDFLLLVLRHPRSLTLQLFSNENMDWLLADPCYTRSWALLMANIVSQGHRIQIIHTLSRDLGEILSAIVQWLPLYMTGGIEPYYYPQKREEIQRGTLFIAPEVAAVSSTTIGFQSVDDLTVFHTQPRAIAALTRTFASYLDLCRPLMRVFNQTNFHAYLGYLMEFEKAPGSVWRESPGLSLMSMPKDVLQDVLGSMSKKSLQEAQDWFDSRQILFQQNLKQYRSMEIIALADPDEVRAGKVPILFTDMLIKPGLYYTRSQYCRHLHNILELLRSQPNYHVYLSSEKIDHAYMIYLKEKKGCMIAKTQVPSVVFAIDEPNLMLAFENHLRGFAQQALSTLPNRKMVIGKIESLLKELN